ncbi:MAG: helicase-related protein, partial [Candidatus Onthovivens sp.]|nr:helicase-related protein [Candidatus Onthovivens sp.]
LFTRMQTAKEQTEILKGAKNGEINLIIGTHKALGNKLEFKDLGLLIIDEEQRFGVEQKEKIKEKYKNIDCLTLSATPIPRTLQSSLIGLKNISKIETPPNERLPIQTYVINYDEDVISELIKRELSRRGQIYYVYNDIDGLYKKQITLQAMVPEARIGIIHGKMDKEDVDIIMDSFYEGEIDLLLSTTIIENGIDVRNANLLLIENADKFGLAQLYQIKGRVGRGDKIAYAYLMIRPNKEITPQSKKRLKAIQDFTELGSGYKIAQRDLLIRGAGDILGKEQAGFIDEVGIDLYIRLLNETIKEKEGKAPKINQKPIKSLQSIDAYIPQTFAENDDKIEIYQKIISINNVDELNKYQEVLTDQYGKLPNNVELLFKKREIDIYFAGDPFDSYNDYKDRIDIKLNSDFSNINGIGSTLFTALIIYINKIKVSYREKQINISVLKISDWLETLIKVLSIIRRVENEVKGAKIYED